MWVSNRAPVSYSRELVNYWSRTRISQEHQPMIAMCDVSTLILMQWTMALLLLCNALLFQITTFGFFVPGFMYPFERLQTEPQCPQNPTFSIDITSFLSYAFSISCYPDRKHCLEALLMEQQLPD